MIWSVVPSGTSLVNCSQGDCFGESGTFRNSFRDLSGQSANSVQSKAASGRAKAKIRPFEERREGGNHGVDGFRAAYLSAEFSRSAANLLKLARLRGANAPS